MRPTVTSVIISLVSLYFGCCWVTVASAAPIIAIPFHTLPIAENSATTTSDSTDSSMWHAEGFILHRAAPDDEHSITTLRIRSTLPLHLNGPPRSQPPTVERVFAVSLTNPRTTRRETSVLQACTSGPMMHSMVTSQLTMEGVASWAWDVPIENVHEGTSQGDHEQLSEAGSPSKGFVENHGNDVGGVEFANIGSMLSPGRYFICAALEELVEATVDMGREVHHPTSRRLTPIAYFDVWGWLNSHHFFLKEEVASTTYTLRGWFPASSQSSFVVRIDGSVTTASVLCDDGVVDALSFSWRAVGSPSSGSSTHQDSMMMSKDAQQQRYVVSAQLRSTNGDVVVSEGTATSSSRHFSVEVGPLPATHEQYYPSVGADVLLESKLLVNLPPNAEYVAQNANSEQHSDDTIVKSPAVTSVTEGIHATLRIMPVKRASQSTRRLFLTDDILVNGNTHSTWGVEISLQRASAVSPSEFIPLDGCTIPGSPLGPTPCFAPSRDGELNNIHIVCELTVRQLASLLLDNRNNMDPRFADVQFHCLPSGPPYHPITVSSTGSRIHDVVLVNQKNVSLDDASPEALAFVDVQQSGEVVSTLCFEQLQSGGGTCSALLSPLTNLSQTHRLSLSKVLGSRSVVEHSTVYMPARVTLRSGSANGVGNMALAMLAGNVRPRLPARVRHAELLLSYTLVDAVSRDVAGISGYVVAAAATDVVNTFTKRSSATDADTSFMSPQWSTWCSEASQAAAWRAPLIIEPTSAAVGGADNSWYVTGTPGMIPPSVLQNVSRCQKQRDDSSQCDQLFSVFCLPHHHAAGGGGTVLIVPVLLMSSFDVSPVSTSIRMECPLVVGEGGGKGYSSCVDMLPRVTLVRQPLRSGFRGASYTLTADEIGEYYCREPPLLSKDANGDHHGNQPRRKPAGVNGVVTVPMEVTDAWTTAATMLGSNASLQHAPSSGEVQVRPHPSSYRKEDGGVPTLYLRANRPLVESALPPSSPAQKSSSRSGGPQRYGPFAICASIDITAALTANQRSTRQATASPDQQRAIDTTYQTVEVVFVGFAMFVPPPMLQAVAVPPPTALGMDALSESWWAFVPTNLDVVSAALSSIPVGGARLHTSSGGSGSSSADAASMLSSTQWLRYPLRLVPFPRSISGRDYMRRHKPHKYCYAPPSASSSPNQAPQGSVRHAMPLSAHDATAITSAAKDMYRTSHMDGAAVWLLRARGAFYGDHAVCACIDGVEEFVGLLNVPGPWYTTPALPMPTLASSSLTSSHPSSSSPNRQTFTVSAGSSIRLAFSVVAHSGAENLRSGLQLLRREEGRWAAMIGTVEPQEDASQTAEDNLVIETPLHYEEVTRPSVSQEVDRVVTAVLTPMVPGVYLVCFAKGLAWDNTSKLASGQQRSPEGLALSAAVRRTLETSSSWIRQFDHDDQAQSAAEQQTSPSSSSPWTALGALHQSVGITPVLGVNRTASVRLPTLSDVNVWTILRVRTPTIIDTKRLIQLHMNGPRVVMTLSSAAVKRVESRSSVIVGWATACVESEYSTSIHKNDVGHRVREGLVDSEEFDESMKDSLGHRPGVALARTISTLADNSVTISFLLSAKNLCGKRSVQLLAGWRRVARAVRTPHRNRFVAHNPQHALDDSDVDAHRVVWRTVAVAVEVPDQILDVMYRDSANSGSAAASALLDATSRNEYIHANAGRGDPQSEDPPPVGLDASPVALDLDDGLDDL